MTVAGFATIGITVDRLVRDTITHLRHEQSGQLNKLDGALTAVAADDTVTYLYDDTGIFVGRRIEIDDEEMHVWEKTGKVLTVERALNGTSLATHDDGSLIRIEPRFSRQSILDALRDEIESWPVQLYGVLVWTGDLNGSQSSLAMPGLEEYTGVRLLKGESLSNSYRLSEPGSNSDTRYPTLTGLSLETHLSDSGYPDGYGLRWGSANRNDGPARVYLGAHFQCGEFASAVDVGTIGLTRTMLDIAPIGAAVRLLFPSEIDRTDPAAITRSRVAADVPPGYSSQTAQAMLGWRDRRISEEVLRLLSDFGWTER